LFTPVGVLENRKTQIMSSILPFRCLGFIILGAAFALKASADESAIHSVEVKETVVVPNNTGDTWAPAWAKDGTIFSPSDDSGGFKGPVSTNIHFNKITGDTATTLDGDTVNPMIEYGKGSELGPDGFTWKSSGCMMLDGVLYWVIARHHYDVQQSAQNASIIKSTDGGKTWTRSVQENYDHPLFPGSRFATPYFIDYGQDGHQAVADGSDKYVYAMSNNGFWDNGDNMILGRVLKTKIGDLKAEDWQFFKSGDGAVDSNWSPDMNQTIPVINNPNHLGMGGPVYLTAQKCYFMIGWHYPDTGGRMKPESSQTTNWDFYVASQPWGPWRIVGSHTFHPEAYYGPQVCLKLTSPDGSMLQAFTCGNFNPPFGALYYKLSVVSLLLK
jgi:hypothetical protein